METNAERRRRKLADLCATRGLKSVAEKAGLSAASLDQIIKKVLLPPKKDGSRTARSLGDEAARKIEDAEDLGRGWFDVADQPRNSGAKASLGAQDNVELLDALQGVPLISWVQAGDWCDAIDPIRPGEADEWLPCPAKNHGARTYCLRVRGESMSNPGRKPSYSDGDIIFVDPDKQANAGDRVIVRLDDQHEVTFKQLVIEDGRKMLKALNPEWAPRYIEINGNATICGVIIGTWRPE